MAKQSKKTKERLYEPPSMQLWRALILNNNYLNFELTQDGKTLNIITGLNRAMAMPVKNGNAIVKYIIQDSKRKSMIKPITIEFKEIILDAIEGLKEFHRDDLENQISNSKTLRQIAKAKYKGKKLGISKEQYHHEVSRIAQEFTQVAAAETIGIDQIKTDATQVLALNHTWVIHAANHPNILDNSDHPVTQGHQKQHALFTFIQDISSQIP